MISFEKVHKSFGPQRVLDGVTLALHPGRINVIIGGSGTGKSVLLKHMIGLMRPDAGRIWVDGVDITALDERGLNSIRKNFGMLFQDAALFDSMTVGENVAFPLVEHTRLRGARLRERVEQTLAQVGLENVAHKMPAQLSGGMRKRVGLARAIVLSPRIILYDEPTTGLDPIMCAAIDRLIVDTQRRTGATTVIISHDLDSTFRIAHFVAMLHEGRIVTAGTPAEMQRSTQPAVQAFIGARETAPCPD